MQTPKANIKDKKTISTDVILQPMQYFSSVDTGNFQNW